MFNLRVHEPIRDEDDRVKYRRTTPYIMFSDNGVKVLLQGREFFSEGGSPMADVDVPDWVWDQIRKTNPKCLAETGVPQRPIITPQE